jgi:16S rRNA (guanine527-N7)-methyltransferase
MASKAMNPPSRQHPPEDDSHQLLVSGARQLGVTLTAGMAEALERFLEELLKWNRKMNLTAVRDKRAMIVRHLLDSLTLVRHLPEGANLLDIGSGAGFPGLPIKIARPDLDVVLLDRERKKIYFQKRIIRALHLSGIESVWGRTDHPEVKAALGGRFDVVVSRAVWPLEVVLRESLGFINREGTIIAMRGKDATIPVDPATLGLILDQTFSCDLPFERITRHLLFFKRTKTPR